MIAAVIQAVRDTSAHRGLDDAMFWVGLAFVATPLTVGLGVAAYFWWKRRAAARAAGHVSGSSEEPGDTGT